MTANYLGVGVRVGSYDLRGRRVKVKLVVWVWRLVPVSRAARVMGSFKGCRWRGRGCFSSSWWQMVEEEATQRRRLEVRMATID